MSPAAIAALQRSADELTAILESASIGIAFTRDRIVLRSNRRAAEIFGYRAAEELVGKSASIMHADEDSYARFATEAGAVLNAGESFHADCQLRKCDGSLVWCSVYAKAVEPDRPDRGTVWMVEDITDAKQAVLTLQQSDSLLDNTFSHMDQGISIVDGELNMLAVNRRFAELLDFPPALCAPGAIFSDFILYNAQRGDYGPGNVEEQVRSRVALARQFEPHQFERDRPDGSVIDICGRPIPGGGFVTIYTDVTKRVRAERALRESEARFRSLTELSSDWFWEQDADLRFTRMEGQHITGDGPSFDSEMGRTFGELGFEVSGDAATYNALLQQHQPFREAVLRCTGADGTARLIRVSGEPLRDAQGDFSGYRGVGRDITREKLAEERIQHLATHDGLTGLANRVLFHEMLGLAVRSARRNDRKLAVLFIDLDHFKAINDTLGHDAGDLVLKEFASRLSQCLRGTDVVARLGGDEFVVLIQDVGDAQQVAVVAHKILAAASEPVPFNGHACGVSASIGICMVPAGAWDEQSIMKNADRAMYAAKEKGKNNFQFFDASAAASTAG